MPVLVPAEPVASAKSLLQEDVTADRLHRFTVRQFQQMIADGVFRSAERVELLDGLIFEKMTQKPPHAVVLDVAHDLLAALLPRGWYLREQKPIVTAKSLPEPDLVVVKGPATRYAKEHPHPEDIAILIEVADTSLEYDRVIKGSAYARSKISEYWIVNLLDRTVEVYTRPRGGKKAAYETRTDHEWSGKVIFSIHGKNLGEVAVAALIPNELFQE